MSTLTADTAAADLLADMRQLLARHDGAESLDKLTELADELGAIQRRVRGRIRALRNREKPAEQQPAPPSPGQPNAVTPTAVAEKQPAARPQQPPPRGPAPMSTPTIARTNTRHRPWLLAAAIVLAVIAALVLLAGCSLAGSQDPLPPGSDQVPAVVDEPDAPAAKVTSCDRAREAFLTGTPAEIKSALRALIADKSADAIAREYAQYYLERDARDPALQDMDKGLIQTSCA